MLFHLSLQPTAGGRFVQLPVFKNKPLNIPLFHPL